MCIFHGISHPPKRPWAWGLCTLRCGKRGVDDAFTMATSLHCQEASMNSVNHHKSATLDYWTSCHSVYKSLCGQDSLYLCMGLADGVCALRCGLSIPKAFGTAEAARFNGEFWSGGLAGLFGGRPVGSGGLRGVAAVGWVGRAVIGLAPRTALYPTFGVALGVPGEFVWTGWTSLTGGAELARCSTRCSTRGEKDLCLMTLWVASFPCSAWPAWPACGRLSGDGPVAALATAIQTSACAFATKRARWAVSAVHKTLGELLRALASFARGGPWAARTGAGGLKRMPWGSRRTCTVVMAAEEMRDKTATKKSSWDSNKENTSIIYYYTCVLIAFSKAQLKMSE